MRPWALITPASKGIGLALSRRILQTTKVPIIATARKDPDQTKEHILQDLRDVDESRVTVLPLDVTGTIRDLLQLLARSDRTQTRTALQPLLSMHKSSFRRVTTTSISPSLYRVFSTPRKLLLRSSTNTPFRRIRSMHWDLSC